MNNKWKIAFYLLLGLNVFLIGLGIVLVRSPIEDTKVKQTKEPSGDFVAFHVASNKKDLNSLINHYLEKEVSDTPINYRVLLEDEVELYGTFPFFSQELDMKLSFEPEALKNGDLVLRQKEISIGRLQLPVAYVLKFIRDNYKLPIGVTIQPNNELIYVSMANIKLRSDVKIKVDEFDLKRDKISFNLFVPVK